MNPYEWPWDNDPGESTQLARATARLRKKVRKLGRKVARMEKDLRRMARKLDAVAAAPPPRPTASDEMRRLVGEAQRTAALYSATRSPGAAAEAARSRDALLTRIAELEAASAKGRAGPTPGAAVPPTAAPPHPEAAPPHPAPPQAAPPPPWSSPPPPARAGSPLPAPPPAPPEASSLRDPSPAGDEVYRWIRDAVSLLRAAGFAGEGQLVLRERLLEQVMELMAQRRTASAPPSPRERPAPGGPAASGQGSAPIGLPRLGPRREVSPPGPEAAFAPDVAPVVVRTAGPPPPPLTWPAPPAPAYPVDRVPRREAPSPAPVDEDGPFQASWGPPTPPPPAPEVPPVQGAAMDPAGWDRNGGAGSPFEALDPGPGSEPEPEAERETEAEPEPRRWWSYAPVPPPDPGG